MATEEGASMTELVRMLMEDRQQMAEERQREEQMAEERQRREEQVAIEKTQLREQMEMLQSMVERTNGRRERVPTESAGGDRVKLTKLTEADDIEAYLTTFERMMAAYEVEETRWVYKLAPQLTGRAQQAYAALTPEASGTYDEVKEAIVRRYDITDETYRQRCRTTKKKPDETYRELATRARDLATKWTRGCTTQEELLELVTAENVLNVLPRDVQVWVRERKPRTNEEAGHLAEDYIQARKTNIDRPPMQQREQHGATGGPSPKATGTVRCFKCGKNGHVT